MYSILKYIYKGSEEGVVFFKLANGATSWTGGEGRLINVNKFTRVYEYVGNFLLIFLFFSTIRTESFSLPPSPDSMNSNARIGSKNQYLYVCANGANDQDDV